MSYQGQMLRLKIGDGQIEEQFIFLEGITQISMSLQRDRMESTDAADGMWRVTGAAMGLADMGITIEGTCRDGASENRLRAVALNGQAAHCQLLYPDGDMMAFAGLVTRYERQSSLEEDARYRIEMIAQGNVSYTAA